MNIRATRNPAISVYSKRRLWIILGTCAACLGFVFAWLINNIFYDLLWEFLEEHNVKHTKVIAFIFSNIIPFIVAVVTVGVIYIIVKREVTGKDSSPRPITGSEPARDVLDTPQKLSKIESRTEPQYLTVSEAIRYLADESEWGARIRAAPPNAAGLKQIPRFAAIDELVRAARNGDLKVFGRFNRTGEHLLISAQYWLYASIDMGSAIGANISPAFTTPTSPDLLQRERFTPYDGLCVERSDLIRIWPRRIAS